MARDVELMRLLLLELDRLQRSPPEGFVLPMDEICLRLSSTRADILAALDLLRALDFIEAPGAYLDDAWIFRKLTRRGEELAAHIADAQDWARVKAIYGDLLDR